MCAHVAPGSFNMSSGGGGGQPSGAADAAADRTTVATLAETLLPRFKQYIAASAAGRSLAEFGPLVAKLKAQAGLAGQLYLLEQREREQRDSDSSGTGGDHMEHSSSYDPKQYATLELAPSYKQKPEDVDDRWKALLSNMKQRAPGSTSARTNTSSGDAATTGSTRVSYSFAAAARSAQQSLMSVVAAIAEDGTSEEVQSLAKAIYGARFDFNCSKRCITLAVPFAQAQQLLDPACTTRRLRARQFTLPGKLKLHVQKLPDPWEEVAVTVKVSPALLPFAAVVALVNEQTDPQVGGVLRAHVGYEHVAAPADSPYMAAVAKLGLRCDPGILSGASTPSAASSTMRTAAYPSVVTVFMTRGATEHLPARIAVNLLNGSQCMLHLAGGECFGCRTCGRKHAAGAPCKSKPRPPTVVVDEPKLAASRASSVAASHSQAATAAVGVDASVPAPATAPSTSENEWQVVTGRKGKQRAAGGDSEQRAAGSGAAVGAGIAAPAVTAVASPTAASASCGSSSSSSADASDSNTSTIRAAADGTPAMTVTAAASVTRTAAHTLDGGSNSPLANGDTGVSSMQAAAAPADAGVDTACVGQPASDSGDMDDQEDASRKRQRSDSTSDSGTGICQSGRGLQHSVCVTPSSHTTSGDSLAAASGGALTAASDELAL